MEFRWELLQYNSLNTETIRLTEEKEVLTSFFVHPFRGTIPARSKLDFHIEFCPRSSGIHAAYLLLLLENQITPRTPDHPLYDNRFINFQFLKEQLLCIETSADPLQLFGNYESARRSIKEASQKNFCYGKTEGSRGNIMDIVCGHLQVFGHAINADVSFEPSAMVFGDKLTIGQDVFRFITIKNNCRYDTEFRWRTVEEEGYFCANFEPCEGTIPGNGSVLVKVLFIPLFVGTIDENFILDISNSSQSLGLNIKAQIMGPSVVIDTPAIDFGIVEVGKLVSFPVQVTNISNVDTKVELLIPNDNGLMDDEFIIEPSMVFLGAKQRTIVSVSLQAINPRQIRGILECRVAFGESVHISLMADVQQALIIIDGNSFVDLGTTFVDTPSTFSLRLKNLSLLNTTYYWFFGALLEQNISPDQLALIDSEPGYGSIAGETTKEFKFQFTPTTPGNTEILIPCFIQDRKENAIGIVIRTETKSLSVALGIYSESGIISNIAHLHSTIEKNQEEQRDQTEQSKEPTILDFGEMTLGNRKEIRLVLENRSGCLAFFSLRFRTYGAPLNHSRRKRVVSFTDRAARSAKNQNQTSSRSALSTGLRMKNTYQRSILSNKDKLFTTRRYRDQALKREVELFEQKFEEEILESGEGVAFDVDAVSGRLDGFEKIDIVATCYSNKCGKYDDILHLEIEGIEEQVSIPVRVAVVGTPIKVVGQTLGFSEEAGKLPILQWRNICFNDVPQTKTIRICNTGILDLEVNWMISKCRVELSELEGRINVSIHDDSQRISDNEIPFKISPEHDFIPSGEMRKFRVTMYPRYLGQVRWILLSQLKTEDTESLRFIHPLNIILSGETILPHLRPKPEIVKFLCGVNDPLHGPLFQRQLQLVNDTQCTLTCSVSTEASFYIKEIQGNEHPLSCNGHGFRKRLTNTTKGSSISRRNVTMRESITSIHSNPESKRIDHLLDSSVSSTILTNAPLKSFVLRPFDQLLIDLEFIPSSSTFKNAEQEQQEKDEHFLTYEQTVQVRFTSGYVQEIPIQAVVHFPQIGLQHHVLDFGTRTEDIHSTASRELVIVNRSPISGGKWNIEALDQRTALELLEEGRRSRDASIMEHCDGLLSLLEMETNMIYESSVFEIGQCSGKSTSAASGASTRTNVKITFRPSRNALYRCLYMVVVGNARRQHRRDKRNIFLCIGKMSSAEYAYLQ